MNIKHGERSRMHVFNTSQFAHVRHKGAHKYVNSLSGSLIENVVDLSPSKYVGSKCCNCDNLQIPIFSVNWQSLPGLNARKETSLASSFIDG